MKQKIILFAIFLALFRVAAAETVEAKKPNRQELKPSLSPYETTVYGTPHGQIDNLVFERLHELGLQPANPSSDAAFLRRVYFDLIGTQPTLEEAKAFLTDNHPDKRRLLIDKLMERDEFAEYWAMKWCDLLRVKAEFPINLWPNAVQSYHRWIRDSIRDNKPFDQFAREMLTSSGSNFRDAPVNFFRAVPSKTPQGITQAVALTFMGTRTETWPKSKIEGMSVFFSQLGYKSTKEWKEEIVYYDPTKTSNTLSRTAFFPDGNSVELKPGHDPREYFADWLLTPKNPWFTRNIVNRAWSWFMGRGIIHEPDDIRPDNLPVNPQLLAFLEREMAVRHYDMKSLFRLILNSQTYQLSSVPKSKGAVAEANFAYYPVRRLEAEVLIDALCQITGTTEKYFSPIPEPFTYIPETQRSISLADASITSAFLEMFGRSSRDLGWESERNNKPSPSQRLHLLNSSHILRKIDNSAKLNELIHWKRNSRDAVTDVYLTILSRFPTEEEIKTLENYSNPPPPAGSNSNNKYKPSGPVTIRRDVLVDLIWSQINSSEFLYKH